MSKLTLTWKTVGDNKVCPICRTLEGYTWIFETGTDVFTNELFHPAFGVVWTIYSGSAAHERHGAGGFPSNCRCHLDPEFDFSDLVIRTQQLLRTLEVAVQTGEAKGEER